VLGCVSHGLFYYEAGLACRGPIYKLSYDSLTIMPKLRSTYDGRLIYKTSYEGRKAFLRYDSLAKLQDRLRQCSQISSRYS